MLFNSFHFLFFFITVTSLYFLLPFNKRWLLLLISSCYFYMAFVPIYILILGFTIVIDYFAGIFIENSQGKWRLFFWQVWFPRHIFLPARVWAGTLLYNFITHVWFLTVTTTVWVLAWPRSCWAGCWARCGRFQPCCLRAFFCGFFAIRNARFRTRLA